MEGCKRLRREAPGSKVVLLTVSEDSEVAAEAIRSGASGYVLKKDLATELLKAIQEAAAGRVYMSRLLQSPGVTVLPPGGLGRFDGARRWM